MSDFPEPLRNDFFTDEPSEGDTSTSKSGSNNAFLFGEDSQIDEVLQSYDNVETYGIYEDDDAVPFDDGEEEDSERGFLGMTPIQRFILSVMIFLMVTILGAFCLILTGKVVIPFF
ncbi:MAG: hypothetical protein V2J07_08265 [Anaerolineae bacterium]|jgi:hypothetical protein|nr:hypothetical protein [Anaerolineae bacterium]